MGAQLPESLERGARDELTRSGARGGRGRAAHAAGDGGVVVRGMRADDVDRVAALEAASFTTPWKAETFRTLLERSGAELHVVAHPEAGVIGYAVLWCILDQGELANIAIDEAFRGRGLGARLLTEVVGQARARGVETLYLEVRASNTAGIGMYRRFGFERIGVRRGYYDRPKEDAWVMMLRV